MMRSDVVNTILRCGAKSVQARICLLTFVISTLVTLAFASYAYVIVRSAEYMRLDRFAKSQADRLAIFLQMSVWDGNAQLSMAIIDAEMVDNRIHAVIVHDEQGNILLGRENSEGGIIKSITQPIPRGDYMVLSRPLRQGHLKFATQELYITSEFVQQELAERVIAAVKYMVLWEFTLVLAILLVVRQSLVTPLSELAAWVRGGSVLRYGSRIPKQADDELGRLVDSMNAMLGEIEKRDKMLNEHSGHLEKQVRERTLELERARQTAEKSSKAKGEYVARMSHELRTPMNAIIGLIDITMKTELSSKQKEYLTVIRSSACSLLGVVNDILDISKIEARRMALEHVPFYTLELLEEVTDLFRERVDTENVELVLDIEPDVPPRLVGDPLRLKQVLINLISNAFKFTKQGEVCIRVSVADHGESEVELFFSVRDTGLGIDEETRNRMFEMFSQADEATARLFGGSGLGLFIARELVRLMGGSITVDSQPGKGSDFWFTGCFAIPAGEQPAPSAAMQASGKALVAEASAANRTVLARMLGKLGYICDMLEDGHAAYACLRQQATRYALVVFDWRLPGMGTLEVLEKLHAEKCVLPPVIAMTMLGAEVEEARAKELGVTAFVSKPVKLSSLSEAMGVSDGLVPLERREKVIDLRQFEGLRALLVEDNIVNRHVALDILQDMGFFVLCAEHGEEALVMLNAGEPPSGQGFDVIFMDIQMPVLDGMETTRVIRQHPLWQHIPIIALSAHVLSEERDRALEAGMNDYVTKPLDRGVLLQVLLRHLDRQATQGTQGANVQGEKVVDTRQIVDASLPSVDSLAYAPKDMPGEGALDNAGDVPDAGEVPGLDLKSGMERLGGKWDVYVDILKAFVGIYGASIENIIIAVEENDRAHVAEKVHTIAGAAANISAVELYKAALCLERASLDGGPMQEPLQDFLHWFAQVEQSVALVVGDSIS